MLTLKTAMAAMAIAAVASISSVSHHNHNNSYTTHHNNHKPSLNKTWKPSHLPQPSFASSSSGFGGFIAQWPKSYTTPIPSEQSTVFIEETVLNMKIIREGECRGLRSNCIEHVGIGIAG